MSMCNQLNTSAKRDNGVKDAVTGDEQPYVCGAGGWSQGASNNSLFSKALPEELLTSGLLFCLGGCAGEGGCSLKLSR